MSVFKITGSIDGIPHAQVAIVARDARDAVHQFKTSIGGAVVTRVDCLGKASKKAQWGDQVHYEQ
ncbi:MAG: hypothetical protein VXW24_04180 [Bacteroidota bacterium]|nr:hypothetical protein [Bacteroidota bacterium]